MIYLINTLDVFYSIVNEFKKCISTSKHYLGERPEKITPPSFSYYLVYTDEKRSDFFSKKTTLDLQIIYFGQENSYGKPVFKDKIETMTELKCFLSTFNLQVGDRNLKFNYSFGEADEQLTINMQFKFKDDLINTKYDEEQARQTIENIYNNKELM